MIRMRARSWVLAVVVFGALLTVPAATAQASPAIVTVSTDFGALGADGRLRPESEAGVGSVWATIEVPAYAFCVEPVPVLFNVKMMPSYSTVQFLDPVQYVEIRPGTSVHAYDVKTLVAVSLTRDAPAFEDGMYQFSVELLPPSLQAGCNIGPSMGSARATIKNDYIPGIRLGDAIVEHDGLSGWVDVPIENHANGPTRVHPIVESRGPDQFVLLNANDMVLDSRATSGEAASWKGVMRISYVLDNLESAPIHVRFVAGHDLFDSEQDIIEAQYQAVGTLPPPGDDGEAHEIEPDGGAVETVPGPSIPMLMLLGGVLLALARRRHE